MRMGYTALIKVECPYLPEGFTAWQDVDGTYFIYDGGDNVLRIPSMSYPIFKA